MGATVNGVLIMAGGTGGHVFPGLAVARRLLAAQIPVAWLGTRHGMEAEIVPRAEPAIAMEWIKIRGVRGTRVLNWLRLPWTLAVAMLQAFRVMRRVRPAVVLSMGGFVAGPGGLVAWLTRTPLLIHEQNAIPGMTNKWLALFADRVMTGFPAAFAHTNTQQVGNPVRAEIARVADPATRLRDRTGALRVLVVGGSRGASAFNQILPPALGAMDAPRPEVWHQCGRDAAPAVEAAYRSAGVTARVAPFIDDMAAAYAWADVVICRAGAMTIAELAAAGVASILVPYPHAVDDHQTANAKFLVERGAAVLLPQREMTVARVQELLRQFAAHRDTLLSMAQAARACAVLDADAAVALACREAMHA